MSAPEPSVVELFVGPEAIAVDVWDQYTYRLSMLEVGVAWTFSFPYSESARGAWAVLLDPVRGIKCGHRITLAVDGDAVLSGVVETVAVGDDDPSRNPPVLVISGRDDLGAAVSGDADPTLTLRGRTLGDAVQAVYQGVGIAAEIGASVDPGATVGRLHARRASSSSTPTPAPSSHPQRARRARRGRAHARALRNDAVRASHPRIGERAQQGVQRRVRALGYRVWTTPVEGSGHTGVIVDRPRTGAPVLSLRRELVDGRVTDRSNVWAGKRTTSVANVPSAVTVFSDAQRGDSVAQKIAREVTNGFLLTDAAAAEVDFEALTLPRYVQSRNASTEAGAQNEAARLCAEANEGFRRYECTVLGHRLEGRLLLPNLLADVRDDLARVTGTWLVVSVEGSGSHDGAQRTKLSLVPDGALSVIPEPEPT